MDFKYDISVVVPIYNVEKYLINCLESIDKQSYKFFELILVDDGSTDKSGSIVDKYAIGKDNTVVIHKQNGGLSSARNEGIKIAKGRYICFVDSDDQLEAGYLEEMYRQLSEDTDLVICDFDEIDCDGNQIEKDYGKYQALLHNGILDKNLLIHELTEIGDRHEMILTVVAWNKLIRTSIMRENLFVEGVLHEDEYFILPLLLSCKKICGVDSKLYHYRRREDSIMSAKAHDNAKLWKHAEVFAAFENRIKLCSNDITLKTQFVYFYCENLINYYKMFLHDFSLPEKELNSFFANKMFNAVKENRICLKTKSIIRYFIFIISPRIYIKYLK